MSGAFAHTNLVLVGLTLSRLLLAVDVAPEFPPAGVVRGDRTVEILRSGSRHFDLCPFSRTGCGLRGQS
jgi:hypothetical protein